MTDPAGDVLITGATGVIGLAVARAVAGAGFVPHLAGRDPARLEAARRDVGSGQVLPSTDLDEPARASALVDTFAAAARAPHGLVCVAGNLGTPGPLASLDFDAFHRSFNANFFSHAAMIQRFIQRGGRHVIVFSGAGLGGSRSFANVSSYSTAKAALTHLVEALSAEVPHMSFNAIAPGAVVSNMTEQALRAGKAVLGHYAEDAEKQKQSGGVSPELAARMVVWLLTQRGPPYVSGRLLAARFDLPVLEELGASLDQDQLRMRRIDGTLFAPRPREPGR